MRPELAALAEGPSPLSRLAGDMEARPHRLFPLPGERWGGASVALWALTDHETRHAQLECVRYLKEVLKYGDAQIMSDTLVSNAEFQSQVLFTALRDAENPRRRWAGSPNELRTLLFPDEREALFAEYLRWCDERSPLRKIRSSEELEELADALSKASDPETSLSFYDSASLTQLCIALASRLASSMRGSSSPSGSASALATALSDPTPPGP